MKNGLAGAVSLVLALLLSGLFSEAIAAAPPRVPLSEAGVEQKAVFIQNLVMESSAVRTIETSEDPEALVALAEARLLVAEARKDLSGGELEAANDGLDAAIKLVNGQARRLSKHKVQGRRMEAAYEKRYKTVQMFLAAFDRVSKQDEENKSESHAATIKALVVEAQDAADSGRMEEANVLIDEAYKATRADLKELREGDVLIRTLDFANAEEEYLYEVDRNDSHFMLLALAVEKKAPRGSFAKRIEDLRKEARKIRTDADKLAGAGDHKEAIGVINGSTLALMKAVRMGGIFVPG